MTFSTNLDVPAPRCQADDGPRSAAPDNIIAATSNTPHQEST
jgi:hypothetical protein